VALVANELIGDEGTVGVVLLTAVAPILLLYATFGRPHTMLFAWLQWGTVLALRAARGGSRRWWIGAGAVLGLSVFVHPTAPLYALTAFAAAAVYAPQPRRVVVRQAWPGVLALLIGFVPYYVRTLHVLGDRYAVGTPKAGRRTFSGRPVWEDALHFMAPGSHDINYFSALAAVGVIALAVQRRGRVLAFCAITVGTPVLFFSFVPANGNSALFFDRYVIPATPAFLTLVLAGCLAIASRVSAVPRAGALRVLVLAIMIAGLLGVDLRQAEHRHHRQQGNGLETVTRVAQNEPGGTVLFGSTGTGGALSTFDFGHPATLLDRYVSLRARSLVVVDDDSCDRAVGFVLGPATPRLGLWLFYAAAPAEQTAARRAFGTLARVDVRQVAGAYFFASSRRPLAPRALIELGQTLRRTWRDALPGNPRVNELLQADRQLLRVPPVCKPYGDLGDPDISPHWPPLTTTHQ
jgi:hypothetical protein